VSAAPPSRDDPVALARAARDRGHAALAEGDANEALRWLDRARRLAPRDQNIALSLATLLLGRDTARAAAMFDSIAGTADLREAWQGLAAARHLLGDSHAAAACLARTLSCAVVSDTLTPLANEVCRGSGAVGWCGITSAGRLVLHQIRPGSVALVLDGRRLRGQTLPSTWVQARTLEVSLDGRPLLGSPIDLARLRRVVGYVEAEAGGLRGWAWQPGNPEADPVIVLRSAMGGPTWRLTAADETMQVEHAGALARPRGFVVPAARLSAPAGAWHVLTEDGRDLLGSPLDPMAEQRAGRAAALSLAQLYPITAARMTSGRMTSGRTTSGQTMSARTTSARSAAGSASHAAMAMPPPALPVASSPLPPPAVATRRRPVDVVVPVHGNAAMVRACLDSVRGSLPRGSRIVVVDDASDEPALADLLDGLADRKQIRLIRQTRNLGFPASANAGIAACPGRDVVLLNSDTLVPPGWLERLHEAACSAPDIGTVTPFSNDASILSYPSVEGGNPIPDQASTDKLASFAWRANRDMTIEIPVGVGFCLYIRRDCLDAVGGFRSDVFAQGYGEENDFCLRARQLGWRHVAAPGVFVAHRGSASFGGAGGHLRYRNEQLLRRLHPGYEQLVASFIRADTLAEARRRLDLVRWRATWSRDQEAVLLITHADGGGVERRVAQSCDEHHAAMRRPIVLRPVRTADGEAAVAVGDNAGFANLRYRIPAELPALRRVLRSAGVGAVEVHHFLNHDPSIYRLVAELAVPYDVHVHDYAWFCPRIALVDRDRRYCGEPEPAACETCVADAGRFMPEDIAISALIARSERFLDEARQVAAPSLDAAARMRRHFPTLHVVVEPHEDDAAVPDPPPPVARDGVCRVCVLGSIGEHKGYDVLLACARDAAARDLPLEFIVVGSTIDDFRLFATGRVFITGRFQADEVENLVRAQEASLGFFPSIWPETWSLGLTELWRAGLTVAAFDFGAPAERILRTGRGFVLPKGLHPSAINNLLVAAVGLSHD
jgi:GT2 family glycosyltransferase